MTESVLISTHPTASGKQLGHITLNKPKSLNALDLSMVQAIHKQLLGWREDDNIAVVFIDGTGEKAFCAGGDIVSMYQAMQEQKQQSPNDLPDFMAQFFAQEYALDYQIHAYKKPIICWGDGIIMGGGLGLFAGAAIKIVTPRSRVAMPEISIGLFPDVGASYFLNKMPPGLGKFLGLTGASVNAVDCLALGLADHFMLSEQKASLIEQLASADDLNMQSIGQLCENLNQEVSQQQQDLSGNLTDLFSELEALQHISEPQQAFEFVSEFAARLPENKLLQRAKQSLHAGSPITAHLVLEQLKRASNMCLADCFKMELSMAYECSIVGEFQEGVRALLIDKDNQAKWRYQTISEVPQDVIAKHFSHFVDNPSAHPLANLVKDYGEYDAS